MLELIILFMMSYPVSFVITCLMIWILAMSLKTSIVATLDKTDFIKNSGGGLFGWK